MRGRMTSRPLIPSPSDTPHPLLLHREEKPVTVSRLKLPNPSVTVLVILTTMVVYALLIRGSTTMVSTNGVQVTRFLPSLDNTSKIKMAIKKKLQPILAVMANSFENKTRAKKLASGTPNSYSSKPAASAHPGSSNVREPVILVWTRFFGENRWIPDLKTGLGCPVYECLVTEDRSKLDESAAVIFHLRNIALEDLPVDQRPSSEQLWVMFNEESPNNSPERTLRELSRHINWTATYRRDSDFFSPYGTLERINQSDWKLDEHRVKKLSAKKKMVAWMVSNCKTPGHRETFVKEMMRYVDVDIYGGCGNMACLPKRSKACYDKIDEDYKFYLSFENSVCKDYVTEKLFDYMNLDIVPIVFGGADYGSIMPGELFYVDALNFTSPKELATFLHQLAEDEERYNSYLTWKTRYKVKYTWLKWVCDLCERLVNTQNTRMVQPRYGSNTSRANRDLFKWWFEEAECTNWETILQYDKSLNYNVS